MNALETPSHNIEHSTKSPSLSPSKLALGILSFSILALGVGLYNAANNAIIQNDVKAKKESDGSLGALLGSGLKKNHLLLIDLSGPIMMGSEQGAGFFSEDSPAVAARKALDKAAKDETVKGVLLRIDSPGGTVGMSQELNAAVKRVSAAKPVVASFGDMAASGGYYTACAADKIVSNPGTLTASIGVIISSLNLKGFMTDKLGIKPMTVKSGKFKDILSPYRDPKPEEVALIQDLINKSYQDFLGAVIEGRTRFVTDSTQKAALIERIKAVADGRVVTGSEALKVGLVDEIGDLYHARKLLDKMAKERFHIKGKDEIPLEAYSDAKDLLEMLGITNALSHLIPKSLGSLEGQALHQLLPMSARYPNQPLWILE